MSPGDRERQAAAVAAYDRARTIRRMKRRIIRLALVCAWIAFGVLLVYKGTE